jgi:hypothetical protein
VYFRLGEENAKARGIRFRAEPAHPAGGHFKAFGCRPAPEVANRIDLVV